MRINNNLMAMNTHRQLGINSDQGAKSIEKLSSGLRINRAGDDAAGLAISEKMRAQVRGLGQASRNAQDAISLVQTAEGALNESQAILQRMRELAVQSANDTNVTLDRDAIQNEVDQLTQEVDRIANTTEFNTRKLLNGGSAVSATLGVSGTGIAANVTVLGGSGDTQVGGTIEVQTITLATNATATRAGAFAAGVATAAIALNVNGVSFNFAIGTSSADAIKAVNDAGLGVTATATATALTLTSTGEGSAASFTSDAAAAGTVVKSSGVDATVVLTGGEAYSAAGNVITITAAGDAAKGLQFKVNAAFTGSAANNVDITVDANGGLNMQIGANQGQDMYVSISDMRSSALGISSLDISTATTAKAAITTINDAITSVSTERAKLGAVQNRLEHTTKNLDTSAENLQASESRIRDVDMAKEMMNFTKNNILSQAAQAMLAQANQAPQGVLQLLR